MNIKPLLAAGLASAALLQAASAAINISGTTTYTQDFDTLPTAAARSEFDWSDDVTIPGFYLHRTNIPAAPNPTNRLAGVLNVPAGRPYVSDGSEAGNTAPNFHGFLSLGTYSSTERALGACPTTSDGATNWSGGTLSIIAVFTNTGARSVDLSDITYDLENWRANSAATNAETISFTYKVGTAAALLAELGSSTSGALFPTALGYQPVGGGSFDYTSPDGFTTPPAPGNTERSGSLTPGIRIAPGQSLALRWGNINDGGTDAQVGIDNLNLNFNEVNSSVTPSVANIVRNDNTSPRNPADDSVTFDLTVNGLGAVNPAGWTISAPAALAGTTGTYGNAKSLTLPISAFTGEGHSIFITVEDTGTPGTNANQIVTAPWCLMTAVVTNITRDSGGNSDPTDDTWGYTVTIDGQFTGDGWASNNNFYSTGSYGAPVVVTGIPIANVTDTAIVTDAADPACTVSVAASPPRIIGTKNFGIAQPLFSGNVPTNWVVDEALFTQTMNNGGGVPAKVYRSEVIDLNAVGEVLFTGELNVIDLTSGFEVADTFNAQLIIDGNTAAPVSLITPYDTLTADGVLTGAEISPATVGPPPVSGEGNFIHALTAVIPASANSVQLVISGNNDSANETMIVRNLLFQLAPHTLQAAVTGAPAFDNHGTADPADDTFSQGVNITPVSAPPASTGWTSNLTPAAGLYADANPVAFGPFDLSVPSRSLVLTDNNAPAVTASVNINSPVPDIVTSVVEGSVQRNDNGTPGDAADDTVTLQLNVSAPVGGPAFALAIHPSSAAAASTAMNGTPQVVTVTLSHVPDHGPVFLTISDVSYPASADRYTITVPPVVVTDFVVARKNLGGGLSDVHLPAGTTPPAEWSNYPSVPAIQMTNGGALSSVTSETIDITAAGEVQFTANLRVLDLTTGFEETDTFKAELIIDGGAPLNINPAALDVNADGVLSGTELAPTGNAFFNYPFSATIPAAATSVQLVVTAINNSANETIVFENALFTASGPPPIVPGTGGLAVNVGAGGKMSAASLAALGSGGEGPLSVSAVQSGPTARGGRVTLQDGFIIYEAPAGVSGVDSFTYSLTDGTTTVTGTVAVAIGAPAGLTLNLLGFVAEGDGNRVGGMGIPGRSYVWQYSSNLTDWEPLGEPAVCPANGVMSVLDPGPLPPSRFYRLVEYGFSP